MSSRIKAGEKRKR